MKLVLIFCLILKHSSGDIGLETEDKNWLVFITTNPNQLPLSTFDQQNCSIRPTRFEGCHGVLVDEEVALTTRSCLGKEQSRIKDGLYVVQGLLDEDFYANNGQKKKVETVKAYHIPQTHCDGDDIQCERHLVLVRFPAINLATPVPIAPAHMLSGALNVPCRVVGWAVWGRVKDKVSPYQMFSAPVNLVDPAYCRESYRGDPTKQINIMPTDLCIENKAGKLCPKNMDGAPVICNKGGIDYLVGIAKARHTLSRPTPIVVSNVAHHEFDADKYKAGFYDEKINMVDPRNATASAMAPLGMAFLTATAYILAE